MADIMPFKALRPKKEYASETASLPYDVFSRDEAADAVKGKPRSFLNIDRPETQFPKDTNMYDRKVYERGRDMLRADIRDGIYFLDEDDSFYIYEMTMGQRSQTGIVALSSVQDYLDGITKRHENTRPEKEKDRMDHIDILNAQTGPIFLAFKNDGGLEGLISSFKENEPEYDFVSGEGIRQRVWKIWDRDAVNYIKSYFSDAGSTYIADGHHRAASAVKVALKRKEKGETVNGYLSVLFPHDQLDILPYNRAIRDLNGRSREEILELISGNFNISESDMPVIPEAKGEMGFLLEGSWYRLELKEGMRPNDTVKGLDVSVLQDMILDPVFGIKDPMTDNSVVFIGGIRGTKELEKRCREDCKAAFSMFPTSMEELMAVADEGRLMPPKSTWFEPKIYSGLFINLL